MRGQIDTFTQTLESLPLEDSQRWDIFLTFMGLKSAVDTHLHLPSEAERKAMHKGRDHVFQIETEEDARIIAASLTELGMSVISKKVQSLDKNNNPSDKIILNTATNRERAVQLSDISDRGEPDVETVRTMGELSGFPQTAIDAYVHDFENASSSNATSQTQLLSVDHVLKEHKETPFLYCIQFRLSKEHWQKELEVARVWCAAIKKYYPALYERVHS
jgi:hypothetical protein